jgi:hypothetical protein
VCGEIHTSGFDTALELTRQRAAKKQILSTDRTGRTQGQDNQPQEVQGRLLLARTAASAHDVRVELRLQASATNAPAARTIAEDRKYNHMQWLMISSRNRRR